MAAVWAGNDCCKKIDTFLLFWYSGETHKSPGRTMLGDNYKYYRGIRSDMLRVVVLWRAVKWIKDLQCGPVRFQQLRPWWTEVFRWWVLHRGGGWLQRSPVLSSCNIHQLTGCSMTSAGEPQVAEKPVIEWAVQCVSLKYKYKNNHHVQWHSIVQLSYCMFILFSHSMVTVWW